MTTQDRSAKFLDLIRRAERGRLKVYLGYGPGVGKTYQMLQEAHRLKADGIDVVVGFVETHGRRETVPLLDGLEILPRRQSTYHGIVVDEFDVDACLARRPQVAIVDELAHTNVPGSRRPKRYEDVQALLAAGIHVITAMNVQHLESLYDTVENLLNVKVRERVPDAVLADADQVVNIDVAPEDLQRRLRDGKIYPQPRVAASLENFFQADNLEQLRELAFRELAGHIDTRRRERPDMTRPAAASGPDQIMVCLSSRGPSSARLLRFGSRLAGRLNRNWYAVYVQTPSEDPLRIDATTQRLLADTMTLANRLGATVFTFKGTDVAETIVRFAQDYRVAQIVIGRPHAIRWWRRALGHRSVAERLIFLARKSTVIVVDADAETAGASSSADSDRMAAAAAPSGRALFPNEPPADPVPPPTIPRNILSSLNADQIVVYTEPVTRDSMIRDLVVRLRAAHTEFDVDNAIAKIKEREAQGSTSLNDGVALPHCRLTDLHAPCAAIAIPRGGILGDTAAKPTNIVFLLLTPEAQAAVHLQSIAAVSRVLQRQDVRQTLVTSDDKEEMLRALRPA